MKSTDLTRRQQSVLQFVKRFANEEGRSPTLKEIALGIGCTAVSTIHRHVLHLIEKGFLERRHGRGNNIVCRTSGVIAPSMNEPGMDTKTFPFYGDVAAGAPITPDSRAMPIELPHAIHKGKEDLFVLRVSGDSMMDDSIQDGDLVVLQRRGEYRNGDRVVALIDHEEATLKELRRDKNGVWLIPHNPDHAPRYYDAERVDIQGALVGVMRSC